LESWFQELWLYWREFFEQHELSDIDADSLARRLIPSELLAALPDLSDRELLAHAIAYECDAMCTRDRRTILRHRDKLRPIPVRILTPTEWSAAISRYVALLPSNNGIQPTRKKPGSADARRWARRAIG
jgi:hypothetical protein